MRKKVILLLFFFVKFIYRALIYICWLTFQGVCKSWMVSLVPHTEESTGPSSQITTHHAAVPTGKLQSTSSGCRSTLLLLQREEINEREGENESVGRRERDRVLGSAIKGPSGDAVSGCIWGKGSRGQYLPPFKGTNQN